jgi:rfaE bifunctional protein nucleotidyltransferase chain/domain
MELSQLKEQVTEWKKAGKKVVLANGCFEILHVGHVRYLQDAKRQGDILVVALNSDDSTQRLKGEGHPILTESERAEMLSALECVDCVVIFYDDTVDRLLVELKPHFHCKGGDYSIETVPEKETVKQYGGTTSITGGQKVQSTSWLIEEIRRRHSQ